MPTFFFFLLFAMDPEILRRILTLLETLTLGDLTKENILLREIYLRDPEILS